MGYLTLDEAAIYATNKKGFTVNHSGLLRAGVYGCLLITAPFGFGKMHNATDGKEEDFKAQLLVIPPSHLMEIEAYGISRIMAAFSIDGKKLYFPYKEIKYNQLRILTTELDRFLISLVSTSDGIKTHLNDAPQPATVSSEETPIISRYQERNNDFMAWLESENPPLAKMTKEQIHARLIARNSQLWTSGFKDWWEQQDIYKASRGRKKTTPKFTSTTE